MSSKLVYEPPAIRVESLGKQFRIGSRQAANRSFREVLSDAATGSVRRVGRAARRVLRPGAGGAGSPESMVWALQDVSFQVRPGEVFGIIGRNGSGKSTLLKVLSRITEPTIGRVEIRGRVASLLEVGTGFHPELTGRENIQLNGAILGMSGREIQAKFDEIVAFAEVGRFLDTPVKRYSSGMYLRLAFAVAAHLEPEILLVDEVLAVGDVEFQEKCLGKMGQITSTGRTVLFVSHNLDAVARLTRSALLLDRGRLAALGSTAEVLDYYKRTAAAGTTQSRTGGGPSQVLSVSLHAPGGAPLSHVSFGEPFVVRMEYATSRPRGVLAGFSICRPDGAPVFTSHCNDLSDMRLREQGCVECEVSPNCLAPGAYYVQCGLFPDASSYEHDDQLDRALDFTVMMDNVGLLGIANKRAGVVRLALPWRAAGASAAGV